MPCANCLDRNEQCIVTTQRRLHVQADHSPKSTDIPRRVTRIEPTLRNSAETSNTSDVLQFPLNNQTRDVPGDRSLDTRQDSSFPCFTQHFTFVHEQPRSLTVGTVQQENEPSVDGVPSEEHDSTANLTKSLVSEDFGPRCFLSFCSRPSIDWVVSKVKTPGFSGVARNIAVGLARVLKVSGSLSTSKAPEPNPEAAWRYTIGKICARAFCFNHTPQTDPTSAYFDEAPEGPFGVVERSWFEARLQAHFAGTQPDDKAWFALRNVLWATGSRIVLSKTASFSQVRSISKSLFENALSVSAELMFFRDSLEAVQALILMVVCSLFGPSHLL